MKTAQAAHERLGKKTALAVFSSDALSSVAYSTEAILLVLLAAGSAALGYLVPIVIAITGLLIILTLSYRQTIHAYPTGGGAYIVAKDNLGTMPGLVAGASLLVDYILTVAVSVSAGVAAITSATRGTRLSFLANNRVGICMFMIVFIALMNLRGVRESGAIFAGPTYLFILSMLALIIVGFYRYYTTGAVIPTPDEVHFDTSVESVQHSALTGGALVWLLLRSFAAGCTALTGVEAISNGIPAFKKPESKNASTTLTWMSVIMTALILGTGFLAYKLNAHPGGHGETLVSLMARHTFGGGLFYFGIQAATAAILVLAANTAYADFPRLASLLAADRFLPRQFANRGDRLVFSNGIVILSVLAAVLIIIFKGEEQAMLPLYAVGVFLSFTLSQSGMIIHWLRERRAEEAKEQIREEEALHQTEAGEAGIANREKERIQAIERDIGGNWLISIIINSLGALITFVVLVVIGVTRFTHGAWAVIVLIPILVMLFSSIHKHYVKVARQLTTEGLEPLRPINHEVIVPISGIHRGVIAALQYAKSIAPEHVTAVYIDIDEEATRKLREKWDEWGADVKLVVLQSPYRSLVRPLMRYIDRVERQHDDDVITIVLPEFVPARWWHQLLHNQSSLLLKGSLLFRKGVIVTSVPYHLKD
ncbi:MAG: APC family permease [Pyrinomonadaceae bacterium]|nr:APC family permease [Pyrinomonadaceae bacterium]